MPFGKATVVGLVGGVASGKTTVAGLFAEAGLEVVDADALAHEALGRPEVRDRLIARFGPGICLQDGGIDRRALGRKVFGDAQAVKDLNAIVHPEVRRNVLARLEARRDDPEATVVLDVPLLLSTPYAGVCDHVVFVEASEATRQDRAAARGWDADELARREAHQASNVEKRQRATFVLHNDGGMDAVRGEIQRFLECELGRPKRPGRSGGG